MSYEASMATLRRVNTTLEALKQAREQIALGNACLDAPQFERELSTRLCDTHTQAFVATLIENLVACIELNLSATASLECLHKVACMDSIKQHVAINASVFKRLASLLSSVVVVSDRRLLADTLLKLSEHKFYDKITFTAEASMANLVDSLSLTQLVDPVVNKNLQEVSVAERVKYLTASDKSVDVLVRDEKFVKDLRFISILLNNSESRAKFAYWHVFAPPHSFRVFTRILDFYARSLDSHVDDDAKEATVYRPMRDLLEIVYKLAQHSMAYTQLFLDEGLFRILVRIFENKALVEFLFDGYVNILAKIISLFYCACKQVYYSEHAKKILSDDDEHTTG